MLLQCVKYVTHSHFCYICLQVTELKLKVDNVERERDFYFDKLRDIEILCQMPLLQSIPVRFPWDVQMFYSTVRGFE